MIPETRRAGRELDVEVAEKVMGWQPLPGPSAATDAAFQRQYWETYGAEHRIAPSMGGLPGGAHRRVPHYSTSIADAWRIVEKLNAAKRYPEMQFAPCEPFGIELWWVGLVNPADVQTTAATLPEAICLAALASLPVSGETRE